MNITKCGYIAVAAIALAAGCKTIVVKSQPENGGKVQGKEATLDSPANIDVSIFGSQVLTVSSPGYKSKEVKVGYSTPSPYVVQLDKFFNISSIPEGAELYVDGLRYNSNAVTPVSKVPINEKKNVVVKVVKDGWCETKVTVTPETPTDIELVMPKDGPGRRMLSLQPTQTGLNVFSNKIHSDEDVGDDSPNAAHPSRLTAYGDDEFVQSICLLPDGKTMVAAVIKEIREGKGKRRYYSNLWKFDATASDYTAQEVTTGDFFDITPNATIDGEGVYFSTTRSGRLSIRSLKFENPEGHSMLTSANTADYLPAVAPSGQELVYTAVLPEGNKPEFLWTKASDGNGMSRQLCEGHNAVWSPDGTKLLYVKGSLANGESRIWIMDANGTNRRQIGQHADKFNDIDPRWSPDGTKIVFSSNRGIVNGRSNYDIWMMDADGRNVKQLTTNSSCDDRPLFAPDGKTIYFRSNRGLTWDIWVMKLR